MAGSSSSSSKLDDAALEAYLREVRDYPLLTRGEEVELARKIKSDVVLLAHGAALVNPEDGPYMLDHTDCHGVQLGSSIERMAVERPLEERATAFKDIHFPAGAQRW